MKKYLALLIYVIISSCLEQILSVKIYISVLNIIIGIFILLTWDILIKYLGDKNG